MKRALQTATCVTCLVLAHSFTGCSWVVENLIDSSLGTQRDQDYGLSRAEQVRRFEEDFLRERDEEARQREAREWHELSEALSQPPQKPWWIVD